MFTAEIDTSQLNILISQFAKESRKGTDEIIMKQTAIIVGHLIAMTPPGKSKGRNLTKKGGIANSAKKLGESSIKADIHSLFIKTKEKPEKIRGMIKNGFRWGTGRGAKRIPEYADSVADLKRIHNKARSGTTGRVKTGSVGQNMALVRASIMNEFIKTQIKKVGILNAGWLRAARMLGTVKRATPAWITRHGPRNGDVTLKNRRFGLAVTVSNNMSYFPKNMESRIKQAVRYREIGLKIALNKMLERKAKKINAKFLKK